MKLLFLLPFLASCASDRAFVAMHAVDTIQTARMECKEIDPITSRLIGSYPSDNQVLVWSLGVVGLFYTVRYFVPEHLHKYYDWTLVSFKTTIVAQNNLRGCQ